MKAAPFPYCLNCDYCDLVIFVIGELSECTSHLVEYAANRGLSRITQIARILRIFVYLRFWSGERGYGYYGLRTQTGKFAVQKRRESEFSPMNRRIASTARSYRRMQSVGNRTEEMDLAPEQYFVYAWRYADDTVCKFGVSTLRTFYARIKAAKTVTYQDIELLGIEVFGTEAEARAAYRQRLKTFERLADRRAWVHFNDVVRQWTENECVSTPPTLDAFKDAFQNDPARREKEREYQQRRSSQKRTTRNRSAAKPGKKRTEKDRAYEREYARKRRDNDPEYKEKQKQRQKAWRAKHPDYDKNRYANDTEYAENRKAARRERYANDTEYRAREKQRRTEFAQNNPDYKQKRREYMREYRKRKKAETEGE